MLYAAWRKYGEPKFSILAILENCELAPTEVRAIKAYGTLHPFGYNMTGGGDLSPMLVPEIAAKMIQTKIRNGTMGKITDSGRKKLSDAHKGNKHGVGYKHTEEWKRAASARLKGNKHAEGSIMSDERKKAIGERSKGNKIMLGRKLSSETKSKMATSQQARRAREKS